MADKRQFIVTIKRPAYQRVTLECETWEQALLFAQRREDDYAVQYGDALIGLDVRDGDFEVLDDPNCEEVVFVDDPDGRTYWEEGHAMKPEGVA